MSEHHENNPAGAVRAASLVGNVKTLFAGNNSAGLIVIILLVWMIFQYLTGGIFLHPRNMGTLLLQTSTLGFVVVGMVVIMVCKGVDLSAGSVIAVLTALGSVMNIVHGVNPVVVLITMLAAGIAIGAFQGFFVAKLGIPAFIVTLAGQLYMRGFSLLVSGGEEHAPIDPMINSLSVSWVPQVVSVVLVVAAFALVIFLSLRNNVRAKQFGNPHRSTAKILLGQIPALALMAGLIYICSLRGLPYLAVLLAVYAVIMNVVLNSTTLGRHIYAVGGNAEAARLSGINPKKIVFIGFLIMGISYFLSSVAMMSRISGFVPGVAPNMELDAMAAAIIGGTSTTGGYGSITGAILGALLLTSIDNGMLAMNMPTFYQYVAKGFILLLAVVIDVTVRQKKI